MDRPLHNNALIMAIAAGFIAIYFACNAGSFVDNDIWFILATGREIVEHGIPYTNPFALHDNMGIVVQQWIPCLISYGLYCLGGFVALGIWCCILSALVVLSLYRLGRLLKGDSYGGEWILLAIAVATPSLMSYLSMRPHAYTMLAFCWLLFFMVKYRINGKPGWLIASVVLVAVHMNFHMALAPFDLVIIACFAIPNVLAPFHKRGRLMGLQLANASGKHWPVLLCLVASAAALFANPYGLDGVLYLVSSYGSAEYKDFIKEMQALAPWKSGAPGMCAIAMMIAAAMAVGKRGLRSIDLPLTVLAFGVGLLAFGHSRNVWLIALFALPLVFSVMHGWSLDFKKLVKPRPIPEDAETDGAPSADLPVTEHATRRRDHILLGITIAICLGAAIASGILLWRAIPTWQNYEKEAEHTPSGLLDYIEDDGVDPQDVRIFNLFNVGGYLEWRGYKVYMDPRPELWSPAISGHDTDYYKEYVDMLSNDDWTEIDYANFLAKYDFSYLIVADNTKLATYLRDFNTNYRNLIGTGEYTLWGKRSEH